MACALPAQVDALERYYIANAPKTQAPLICIDEISISGLAKRSMPVGIAAMRNESMLLNLGINAFGGMMRWVALPDAKILIVPGDFALVQVSGEKEVSEWLTGHVCYIDQNTIRHSDPLDKWLVHPLEKYLSA